jgi:hypothetical protein
MFIKQMVIEGVEGDVEIVRVDGGALVIANDVERFISSAADDRERWELAWNAARVLCGEKDGLPNASNSMVWDIQREIERISGR